MRTVALTLTALALLHADNVTAFWRMNCGIIQRGRIDPLVSPGAIAAHVHTIVGGSSELNRLRSGLLYLTARRHRHQRNIRDPFQLRVHVMRDPYRQVRLLDS